MRRVFVCLDKTLTPANTRADASQRELTRKKSPRVTRAPYMTCRYGRSGMMRHNSIG